MMESTGNAALDRNLDDEEYDFSGVEDPVDRAALEACFTRVCRSQPHTPMSWEDVQLLCKHQFLEVARRDPQTLAALRARMLDTKARFANTADMVRHRFFGLEARPDVEGRLATEPLPAGEQRYAWVRNEFPYLLQPGIDHWLLWMNVPEDSAETERQVRARVPPECECCWAAQKAPRQTIPAVAHVQCFVRQRRQ